MYSKSGGVVVANVLGCNIEVSKFNHTIYIHFWTNTLEKDMNPLTLQAID